MMACERLKGVTVKKLRATGCIEGSCGAELLMQAKETRSCSITVDKAEAEVLQGLSNWQDMLGASSSRTSR
jgi:hypothetical protein